jgi:hypothetical protein
LFGTCRNQWRKKIKVSFYHQASSYYGGTSSTDCRGVSDGWFIDGVEIKGLSPIVTVKKYNRYIPPPCTSTISVNSEDPSGGNLIYHWDVPDGGQITGTGNVVTFAPGDTICSPCRVRVYATSDLSFVSSLLRTIEIYSVVEHDANDDGDIDGQDLFVFASSHNVDMLERFAKEYGMVACQ